MLADPVTAAGAGWADCVGDHPGIRPLPRRPAAALPGRALRPRRHAGRHHPAHRRLLPARVPHRARRGGRGDPRPRLDRPPAAAGPARGEPRARPRARPGLPRVEPRQHGPADPALPGGAPAARRPHRRGRHLCGRHVQAARDGPARPALGRHRPPRRRRRGPGGHHRPTSRRPTRCCTPPRPSASTRPTASTSATPRSTCSRPGPPGWPPSPSPGARGSATPSLAAGPDALVDTVPDLAAYLLGRRDG